MIKPQYENILKMYSISRKGSNELVEKIPHSISSFPANIIRVFPIRENTFIFFDSDGVLSLFDAFNLTLTPLPFPGVGCLV